MFEGLVERVTADPSAFPNSAAVARSAGITVKKLDELLSDHAHLTPQSWLRRLRIRKAAATLLATRRKPAEIAADVRLDNEREFEAEFLDEMRMTPAAYRALGRAQSFQIPLPAGYRAGEVLAYHARDPEGLTERSEGNQIWKALTTADGPVVMQLHARQPAQASVQVHSDRQASARDEHGGAPQRCVAYVGPGQSDRAVRAPTCRVRQTAPGAAFAAHSAGL